MFQTSTGAPLILSKLQEIFSNPQANQRLICIDISNTLADSKQILALLTSAHNFTFYWDQRKPGVRCDIVRLYTPKQSIIRVYRPYQPYPLLPQEFVTLNSAQPPSIAATLYRLYQAIIEHNPNEGRLEFAAVFNPIIRQRNFLRVCQLVWPGYRFQVTRNDDSNLFTLWHASRDGDFLEDI